MVVWQRLIEPVIFVNGIPKLADIGTVSGVDEHSMKHGGTLGFSPASWPAPRSFPFPHDLGLLYRRLNLLEVTAISVSVSLALPAVILGMARGARVELTPPRQAGLNLNRIVQGFA